MAKYIVGKIYEIPCTNVIVNSKFFLFPILHTHVGDISGEKHHHLDIRFASDSLLEELSIPADMIIARDSSPKDEIVYMSLECIRQFHPIKKYRRGSVKFLRLLERKNKNKKVNETLVCPHQGFDLEQAPILSVRQKMCRICPCHGLAWSVDDGGLVQREKLQTFSL